MNEYNPAFARMFNAMEQYGFAMRLAPRIMDLYEPLPINRENRMVLDLCCGTGQLSLYFLQKGFNVVGLDLSSAMLEHARENTRPYVETGQAKFIEGDATDFKLDLQFGLVTSTYDALNHLDDLDALLRCFRCVFQVLADGGLFVFDLNTRAGLMHWNNINIRETEDYMIIERGIYDGRGAKAYNKVSGFIRVSDAHYERFNETMSNTVWEIEPLKTALLDIGWKDVYIAGLKDLRNPITEPEQESKIFIIARK